MYLFQLKKHTQNKFPVFLSQLRNKTGSKHRIQEYQTVNDGIIIPAKAFASDYVITGAGLSVCYHDN